MTEAPQRNHILTALTRSDRDLLAAYLKPIELPLRKVLENEREEIKIICFPESGFVSVVAHADSNRPIEVGIIGREGMTGCR